MKHEHIQHRFIGREMTLTFGGEKIKGNLTKDLDMTNKEKYIPKLGEAVLSDSGNECIVLHVGEKSLFVKWSDGEEFSADFDYFRQIPTKSDVEREQLQKIVSELHIHDYIKVNAIQNAGFTIPKKVKRSEIADVVANTSPMISVEDLVDEICNLLGDLVEDN